MAAPKCYELVETGERQRRWMSLPGSRIVVNPYRFGDRRTPSEQSNGPDLPLNVGYYANGTGYFIDKLLTIKRSESECERFETSWMPHQLPFAAVYADGLILEGEDFFADTNTLVRTLTPSADVKSLIVGGRHSGELLIKDNVILIRTEHYVLAIASSSVDTSLVQERAEESGRIWSVELELPTDSVLSVAVAFATLQEGLDEAAKRANEALEAGEEEGAKNRRVVEWNDYLESVPHPRDFGLDKVEPRGITEEEVRKTYYRAWVFLHANLLPVMKETDYEYMQQPTGKPSMWLEGHPLSRPSASWESFFGMQLYGFVDSEAAWSCFEGMISLVDDDGMLAGESLPSRKAQTAFILYNLTNDEERLKAIYPALKRYLLWRRDNPRWIYGDHDNPAERDADFASSAIVDMGYARQICEILGTVEEAALWEKEQNVLLENYLKWFWEAPESAPNEYFYEDSKEWTRGNDLWMANGLYIDFLESPHEEGLFKRFQNSFDPDKPFCGFRIPKYPELSFMAYALLDRGRREEAEILINTVIRDVCRANMFAEQYFTDDFPHPDGVRPSIFGLACIIDMIWLKNGFRIDKMQ